MEIIRFLKYQHEEAKDLLDQIIVQDDANRSHSLLDKVSKILRVHMQIEETFVYPAANRCFKGDPRQPSVLEAFEEHELARQCLSALQSTPPADEHFVARAKVLKAVLREHMLEEESGLFPSLATKLGQSGIDVLSAEVERQLSRIEAEPAGPASAAATEPPETNAAPATKSRSAKVAQDKRPATNSRTAKVARTRRPATKSSTAKVARTRRQRSTVRGAKGSRRQATARSAKHY